MKCSQCGRTSFIKIDFLNSASIDRERQKEIQQPGAWKRGVKNPDYPFNPVDETAQVFGYQFFHHGDDDAEMRIVGSCDCYICENCGHIELFAPDLVDKIHAKQAEEKAKREKKDEEQKQLERDRSEISSFIENMNSELVKQKALMENEEISFKEHKLAVENYDLITEYLPLCKEILQLFHSSADDIAKAQKYWAQLKPILARFNKQD